MGRMLDDDKLKDEEHRLRDYLVSRGFTLWDIKLLLMRMDTNINIEIMKRRLEVKKK